MRSCDPNNPWKIGRRHVITCLIAVVLACVLFPFAGFLSGVVVFTRKWSRQASQGRRHLFLSTDYQELLVACRSLSKRAVADGTQSRSCFNVHFGERDLETLSFPQVILDLKAARIFADFHGRGEVVIELFPGPEWFGVTAFPEGSEGDGDVKLVEGLWYFDPAYSDRHPEHVKQINAMIEEGRRRKGGR